MHLVRPNLANRDGDNARFSPFTLIEGNTPS